MRNLIIGAVALIALAFGAYYIIAGSSQVAPVTSETVSSDPSDPAAPNTGTGPTLEITVAGQANGTIVIELFDDVAPQHVERITTLARSGAYDGVVFHRVINGFMAQTGDVEFGQSGGDTAKAGRGGSDMPDLAAEFSDRSFGRGVVGMARSNSPDSRQQPVFHHVCTGPTFGRAIYHCWSGDIRVGCFGQYQNGCW